MNDHERVTLKPWTRQPAHVAGLFLLMIVLNLVLNKFGTSSWWSLLAFVSAASHQGVVAYVWRREIFHPSSNEDQRRRRVRVFAVAFALLVALRLVLTVILSKNTTGSIDFNPLLRLVAIGAIVVLAGYTFYSVIRYFGMYRALGADHFDSSYRQKPFVTKGIHRFTSNSMYTFGILPFLLPGLLFQSAEGMAFGLYRYIAIWLYYWATEKPDIRHLYGSHQ